MSCCHGNREFCATLLGCVHRETMKNRRCLIDQLKIEHCPFLMSRKRAKTLLQKGNLFFLRCPNNRSFPEVGNYGNIDAITLQDEDHCAS